MSKSEEMLQAIQMRKRGKSYSEILTKISVAKSTLSVWLRSVGLSKSQKQRLTAKRLVAMQRGADKMRHLRLERLQRIKDVSAAEIPRITRNERLLIGIALYWAEGSKEKVQSSAQLVKFSNSDPAMLRFFHRWLHEFLKVTEASLRYELYIHESAHWLRAKHYWIKQLGIDPEQIVVYFKRHNIKTKRKNIGENYNGLIRISVRGGVHLNRRIQGWIAGVCKRSGVV